ncbi:unnamed protein product, partial [Didymodactylos carnosus]
VVDGIGGTVKRMVYEDIMAGKKCKNAGDFVRLIKDKSTPIIIDELLTSEIEYAEMNLKQLFEQVKPVPNIQKVHSVIVWDVDKIECKLYSNSSKGKVVCF